MEFKFKYYLATITKFFSLFALEKEEKKKKKKKKHLFISVTT